MTAHPAWLEQKTGRQLHRLPVTRLLNGDLELCLHAVVGALDGPTLGLVSCIHGDETLTPMAIKALLDGLDPARLAGRLVVVPVANPVALGVFDRQTPEQHGNTDLHTVFPGNLEKGNLTHRLAVTLQTQVMNHVDAFIDFHSGGAGGRLQGRSDYEADGPEDLCQRNLAMCRAFGAPFIHRGHQPKSATSYAHGRGIPSCHAEMGGAHLGPKATDFYLEAMTWGLLNIMSQLGMLPDRPLGQYPPQILFGAADRREINPTRGGYLRSYFEDPGDLGRLVSKDQVLGEVVDLHTLEVCEELTAPEDGYLFFSRYSGAVDAGTKAFALASSTGAQWLA